MDQFTLSDSDMEKVVETYGSTDAKVLMPYGYAYGRLDSIEKHADKVLVRQEGVGRSEVATASWFAYLYANQTGVIQYGLMQAWSHFEATGGRQVSRP